MGLFLLLLFKVALEGRDEAPEARVELSGRRERILFAGRRRRCDRRQRRAVASRRRRRTLGGGAAVVVEVLVETVIGLVKLVVVAVAGVL